MPEIRAGLRLTADARGFAGELKAGERAIRRLAGAVDRGAPAADRHARATDRMAVATRAAGKSFLEAHGRHLRYLSGFAGVYTLQRAARAALAQADSYTRIANSVRLATRDAHEYVQVQNALFDVAQRTRTPLAATADLYRSLSISAADLGASQRDLLAVVEGVGQALAVGGTDAAAASGALLQLSQALGAGTVRAEEFNSLIDGAPVLLRTVARHMDGMGGSVARLRQAVIAGEVSSRQFFAALLAGLPDLARQFDRTTGTVAQALTRLDNATTRAIGRFDDVAGVSDRLARSVGTLTDALDDADVVELADTIDTLGDVALVTGGALGGRLAVALGTVGVEAARTRIALLGTAQAARADAITRTATRLERAQDRAAVARQNLTEAARAHARAEAALNAELRSNYGSLRRQRQLAAAAAAANQDLAAARRADAVAASIQTKAARAHAIALRRGRTAVRALRGALAGLYGLLGGPLGVFAIATGAVLAFREANDDARESVDRAGEALRRQRADAGALADELERASTARLELLRLDVQTALESRSPARAGLQGILGGETLADLFGADPIGALQERDLLQAEIDRVADRLARGTPTARGRRIPISEDERARAEADLIRLRAALDAVERDILGLERRRGAIDAQLRPSLAGALSGRRARGGRRAVAMRAADAGAEATARLHEQLLDEYARFNGELAVIRREREKRLAEIDALAGREDTDPAAVRNLRARTEALFDARRGEVLHRRREAAAEAAEGRGRGPPRRRGGRARGGDRGRSAAPRRARGAARVGAAHPRDPGVRRGRRARCAPRRHRRRGRAPARRHPRAARGDRGRGDRPHRAHRGRGRRARADAVEHAAARRLAASTRWQDGVRRGLDEVGRRTVDFASVAEDAVVGAFDAAGDAIEQWVRTGDFSIRNFVRDALAQLARLSTQAALFGLFDVQGSPGITGRVDHGGGVAGALSGRRRTVPAAAFAVAPRLHRGGIAGDEVPAILRRGEGVFTPEQMAALGGPVSVVVRFENRGTAQRQVGEPRIRLDAGRRLIVDVVTDDIARGGRVAQAIAHRGRVV